MPLTTVTFPETNKAVARAFFGTRNHVTERTDGQTLDPVSPTRWLFLKVGHALILWRTITALPAALLTLACAQPVLGDDKPVFDHFLLDSPRVRSIRGRSADAPMVVDLRRFQTSIKNQGGRDTCPYFPPVAALEAAYRHIGIEVDLSTEHLVWLRNVTSGSDRGDCTSAENLFSMLGGGNGMDVLKNYGVCGELDMPYHGTEPAAAKKLFGVEGYDWTRPFSQFVLNRWNLDPKVYPPQARVNARYGIDEYRSIAPRDLANPRRFEEVLANGYEIIASFNLHGRTDDSAAGKPVWRLKPDAKSDSINHFMLLVGYDRRRRFFIVKNQWGPTSYDPSKLAPGWKDVAHYSGYTLVDYGFLKTCSEAHYITRPAPVGSPRFVSQRALGQWQVAFRSKGKELMKGVLSWRRLPDHQGGARQPDLRIGDLVTEDGRQFRVNAYLTGAGSHPFDVRMYIDFARGYLPGDSTNGTVLEGTLDLGEGSNRSMTLRCHKERRELLWNVPASDVECHLKLVEDVNLLLAMKQPK
jgi:hypothetical protein